MEETRKLRYRLLALSALFLRGTTAFGAMVSVTLRETAFSCLLLVVFHPVLTFLHRKFMV